eukprot:6214100-Pleurochrysis_carterae.AAC.3
MRRKRVESDDGGARAGKRERVREGGREKGGKERERKGEGEGEKIVTMTVRKGMQGARKKRYGGQQASGQPGKRATRPACMQPGNQVDE